MPLLELQGPLVSVCKPVLGLLYCIGLSAHLSCGALEPYEIHQVCTVAQVCRVDAPLVLAIGAFYVRRGKKRLGNLEYSHFIALSIKA